MLPKSSRLNLKTDFKWVASGKVIDTKFARLFYRPGENQSPRVGIATSSKIFKKAVLRNRARRLLSAAFEVLYPRLPQHANLVVMPKIKTLDVKSEEILVELEQVLSREQLI